MSRELNKLADPRTATTPRAEAYAMSSEIRTLRAPTLLSKLFSGSETRFHHEPPRGAFGRQSRGLAFFDPLRLGFFDPLRLTFNRQSRRIGFFELLCRGLVLRVTPRHVRYGLCTPLWFSFLLETAAPESPPLVALCVAIPSRLLGCSIDSSGYILKPVTSKP